MKNGKQWVAASLTIALMLQPFLYAQPLQAAKKVKLNQTKMTLTVGNTDCLKVLRTTKKVKWTINKKGIVEVKKKNATSVKIKAKKVGIVKVSAKVGSKKFTCTVSVKKKNAISKQITASNLPSPISPKVNPTTLASATITTSLAPSASANVRNIPTNDGNIDDVTREEILPTASAKVVSPNVSANASGPAVSAWISEPTMSAIVSRPAVSASPSVSISVTSPVVSARVSRPTVTPKRTMPVFSANVTTPVVSEIVTTPVVSEIVATPVVSEIVATPTVSPIVTTPMVSPEPTKEPEPVKLSIILPEEAHNLIYDGGFEKGGQGWQLTGSAKFATHHTYSGNQFVTLDGGSISQVIEIPETGEYDFSAYISTAILTSKMTIYDDMTNQVIQEMFLPAERDYCKRTIAKVNCQKGQRIRLTFRAMTAGWADIDQVRVAKSCYQETDADYLLGTGDCMILANANDNGMLTLMGKKKQKGIYSIVFKTHGKKNTQYRLRAKFRKESAKNTIKVSTYVSEKNNIVRLQDPVKKELSTDTFELSQSFFVGNSDDEIVCSLQIENLEEYTDDEKIFIEDISIEEDPTVVKYEEEHVILWIPKQYVEKAEKNNLAVLFPNIAKNTEEHYQNLCNLTGIDVLYNGEPLNITVGFDKFTTNVGAWSGTNILNIIRVSKYNIEGMLNFAITDTDYYVDPNNPDGQIPASNAMSYFTILHEVSHCFDFLNNNWNFRGELMANFKAFYTMSLLDCNNRSDYKRAHIIWDNKCFANLSEIKQRCKVNGNGIDWMTKAAEGWKASDNKEAFWNKVDTNYRNWSDHFNCDDGINYCLLNVVEKVGWNSFTAAFHSLNGKDDQNYRWMWAEDQYQALMTATQKAYHEGGSEVADSFIKGCDTSLTGEEMQQFIYEYVRHMRRIGK
ncbi:MAG: hypothetical protein II073_06555 [Lachnospiraceae bacterium]|nr:hypothetical protein [Lachnospiraceae bacterium]